MYDLHAGRERRDAPHRSEYLQIVASAVRRTSDDKDAEPSTPAEPIFPGINISTSAAAKPGKPKLPGAKTTAEPKAKRTSPIAAGGATDTGDIPLIRSGLFGLAAAVAFLILTFPVRHLGIFQLIWDRGPIPFVTLLLTTWSLAILVLKWRKLKQQREAMLLDVLPTELSREITLDSLDKFQQHIHGLPGDAAQSFLVNRVVRGLEHFRVRKSAAETVTMMESQSDIDANNVASSYTIVKVFIWALPIMGFIGTVIGVSSAVASLARDRGRSQAGRTTSVRSRSTRRKGSRRIEPPGTSCRSIEPGIGGPTRTIGRVTTRRIVSDMNLLAGWQPRSEDWTYTTHLGGEFRLGQKPPPKPPSPPKPAPPEPPKPPRPPRVSD